MARILTLAMATAVAALAVGSADPALAQDGEPRISTTAASVFKLQPNRERVAASVELTVRNAIPDNESSRSYVDRQAVSIQRGARNVDVTGTGTSIERVRQGDVVDTYEVTFPRLFNGERRKLRVSYELPAAGSRSDRLTRINDAYAHFCFHGQGTDKSSVSAVLPRSHRPERVSKRLKATEQDGRTTIVPKGQQYQQGLHCVETSHPSKLLRQTIEAPSGAEIVVEGWPEDPEWVSTVGTHVDATVPLLEAWTATPLPSQRLEIKQSARQALGGYDGAYDQRADVIRVGEDADDPTLITHELAHAWFNNETMAETWMAEGAAEWAARSASGYRCTDPASFPAAADSDLRDWQHLGVDADEFANARVSFQYAASCWIHQEVSSAMGLERMTDVYQALLERTSKYDASAATAAEVPDWREWLDAVDEVGLLPAGVEDLQFAERLLVDFGVADPADLRGRAEAREHYHLALDSWGSYMPLAVREHMDEWRFDDAVRAMNATDAVVLEINRLAQIVSEVELQAILDRMADARTLGELDDLRVEAAALA